jgi:hypothetical protein
LDARASIARECHRAASAAEEEAARYRQQRDELLRRLRADDPQYWTLSRLARMVGCSKELVYKIVGRLPV